MMSRKLIVLLSLLFCVVYGQAQSQILRDEVKALFPPNSDLWIKSYQGTLNGIHDIQMVLAFNGTLCKGIYQYPTSDTKFILDGTELDNGLELLEIDENEEISAYINLEYDIDQLSGSWNHIEKDISIPLTLEEVSKIDNTVSACSQNSWQRIYEGVLDGSNISVKLAKESNVKDLLVLMEMDNIPFQFNIQCQDTECSDFEFDMSTLSSVYGKLQFRMMEHSMLSVTADKPSGEKKLATLKLDKAVSFDCLDFADYTTRIDLIFPLVENSEFDRWMEQQVMDWQNRMQHDIRIKKEENPGEIPSDRFIYEVVGWVDVFYFSDNFISGIMTFQNNWSSKAERITFNYHFDKKRNLVNKDIFDKDFVHSDYFVAFITDHKNNYIPFKAAHIKEWIDTQDFSFMNFTDEGICFSSEFHTIFGSKQIILPYEDVKKHLKKTITQEFID